MTYAKGTSVSIARSKEELDRILRKAGATSSMLGSDDVTGFAFAAFVLDECQVRLRVPMPKKTERRFTHDHRGWLRAVGKRDAVWDQACRERWRGLVLLTKAKLEAIEMGVSTVRREFLADLFLASGRTLHEELEASLADGEVPRLPAAGLANGAIDR